MHAARATWNSSQLLPYASLIRLQIQNKARRRANTMGYIAAKSKQSYDTSTRSVQVRLTRLPPLLGYDHMASYVPCCNIPVQYSASPALAGYTGATACCALYCVLISHD
jgi:hypothetical protein